MFDVSLLSEVLLGPSNQVQDAMSHTRHDLGYKMRINVMVLEGHASHRHTQVADMD